MKKWRIGILILIVLFIGVLPVVAAGNGKIAFVSNRDGNLEIYVMNSDGTDQTRLTTNPTYDGEPGWSPDGSKIVFVSDRDGNNETYVMNADGTNQIRITNNPAEDIEPAWSPDGSKIAFSSNRDGDYGIFIMNIDGTNQQYLAKGNHPTWSPDGSNIAFVSIRDGSNEIYVMSADGTSQTRITSNQFTELQPVWSPDGTKIAFASNREGTWIWGIYSMNPDGTGISRLTMEDDGEPAWSPDGSKIVFQSWRNNAIPQIYIMNTDGTGQTRITFNSGLDSHPAWGASMTQPPVANAGLDQTVIVNEVVKFDGGGSTDPDGTIVSYAWDFGDTHTGSGVSISHAYSAAGTYTMTLTVTDNDGLIGSDTAVITVKTPITNVPVNIKIVPKTINKGNNGYFLAFVTLPEAYKGATIDMKTVSCSGAPAVRMVRPKIIPRIAVFVFKTSDLKGVGVDNKVALMLNGELKNKGTTYTFTGSDTVKVINKPTWQPDDIKDVDKVTDDQLIKKYSI
jgi:dipeptidyl aminopeptidase/acylaminoacyl peptidase